MEAFKNLSDLAKFVIMLLIYTGYMTWWASGVDHDIMHNSTTINSHIVSDAITTQNTVRLAETMYNVQDHQEENSKILKDNIKQHTKCGAIMDAMLRRLESVEERIKEEEKHRHEQQYRGRY